MALPPAQPPATQIMASNFSWPSTLSNPLTTSVSCAVNEFGSVMRTFELAKSFLFKSTDPTHFYNKKKVINSNHQQVVNLIYPIIILKKLDTGTAKGTFTAIDKHTSLNGHFFGNKNIQKSEKLSPKKFKSYTKIGSE